MSEAEEEFAEDRQHTCTAQDPWRTYFAQTTMFTLKRSRSTGKACAKQGQQTSGAQGLESLFRLCYMDGWPSTPQPASSPLHSCFSPAEQSDRGRFCDGCLGMDDGCSFDGRNRPTRRLPYSLVSPTFAYVRRQHCLQLEKIQPTPTGQNSA